MIEIGEDQNPLMPKEEKLCLDFVNTANWHASEQPGEEINRYADLVVWAREKGVITDRTADRLLQQASRHPGEAAVVLERAITLREALYRIFSAIAGGHPADNDDLVALNEVLVEALTQLQIVATEDGFAWNWIGHVESLDWMLLPIARSAADLLASPEDLKRVGECADDRGCGWIFYDQSRNHSRRWCDMKDCGNRAKVRRHYQHSQSDD
jgi:predicted RNA-binding Zn ribbon-like protein